MSSLRAIDAWRHRPRTARFTHPTHGLIRAQVWTMFVLPLAVAVTLWSLTPLWALPVSVYFGQKVSGRAGAGAVLATGGVVMLAVAVT